MLAVPDTAPTERPCLLDSNEFFGDEGPEADEKFDGYGRYLLNVDGTKDRPYTRATTIADTMDPKYHIHVWEKRSLARGVALRPDLIARACASPVEEKAAWREIEREAEAVSGQNAKAQLGSAFHTVIERHDEMTDEEYAALPVEMRATYEKFHAELARYGITIVAQELTLVNTHIGVAGRADALLRLTDGTLVIGDWKTGRVQEYPHAPAQQFAIYANADIMMVRGDDGVLRPEPMPPVSKTMAIAVDITVGDANTASVYLCEVDIDAGWSGVLLSTKVRRWRNRKDLIMPYHADHVQIDEDQAPITVWKAEQTAPTGVSPLADAVGVVIPIPNPVIPDGHHNQPATAAPAAAMTQEQIGAQSGWMPSQQQVEQAVAMNAAPGPVEQIAALNAAPSLGPVEQAERTEDSLMKLTKAELQKILKDLDPTANLARQRKNLAHEILARLGRPVATASAASAAPVDAGAPVAVAPQQQLHPVQQAAQAAGSTPNTELVPGSAAAAQDALDRRKEALANPAVAAVFSSAPEPNPFADRTAAPVSAEEGFLVEIGRATSYTELSDIWKKVKDAGEVWSSRLQQAADTRATTF